MAGFREKEGPNTGKEGIHERNEPQPTLPLDYFKPETPVLSEWDVVLLNSSGGKDSQTMMRQVIQAADAEGYSRSHVVVVHADLGRVEWQGTKELAREQAKAYGLEFRGMARPQGDLLTHIEAHGKFPGPTTRYCTSDHKRGQIRKIITALDRERRKGNGFKVLNCLGLRAQESPARRKKRPFAPNGYYSTNTREVWDWLPIHNWTEEEVWADIAESGVRYHEAYDIGMPRLSCVFCIYAPTPALVLAARHNPELLDDSVAVEERIGHRFKEDLSMAKVKELAKSGEPVGTLSGEWNM
ncbi:MAG: phosphoadenosine phosphosulfate reductase family protein [Chloroflexota bacterium]|nr:phosphoadenosine phosphosulfate reductase family protein [Chloroflexota bacterium]